MVSCRRGGTTAAFDRLNKYFTISSMQVVGSQYWNQIHGRTAEDAKKDLEGLQTMIDQAYRKAEHPEAQAAAVRELQKLEQKNVDTARKLLAL